MYCALWQGTILHSLQRQLVFSILCKGRTLFFCQQLEVILHEPFFVVAIHRLQVLLGMRWGAMLHTEFLKAPI
jgi:hypothetical protein